MIVDVIIPSKTSPNFYAMTKECIDSLRRSEPSIDFNVVIVESEKENPQHAGQDRTIVWGYPTFNYNKALNLGISSTNNEWVILTNNDVVFHPGWFCELVRLNTVNPDLMSFCSWCDYDNWHPSRYPNIDRNTTEYIVNDWIGYGMSSWTITAHRRLLNAIGPLSDRVTFWYSDNVYADALRTHGFTHVLSTRSNIDHLGSKTIQTCTYNSSLDRDAYYEKTN